MTGSYKSAAANFMGFGYMKKRKKPFERDVTYFYWAWMLGRGLEKRKRERQGRLLGESDRLLLLIRVGYAVGEGKNNLCVVLASETYELAGNKSLRLKGGRPYLVSRRPLFNLETSTLGTRGLEGPFGYKPWSWGWSGMHPQQRDTVISCSHPIEVRGPRAMLDH